MKGRRRKQCKRQPNGQPSRKKAKSQEGPAWTEQLKQRRSEVAGREEWRNPKAGYALGLLELAGRLSDKQHDAGCRYRALWLKFSAMVAAPRCFPTTTGSIQPGYSMKDDEELWKKVKGEVEEVERSVKRAFGKKYLLAVYLLDEVCVQDKLPISLCNPRDWPEGNKILMDGLNVLAEHFG